MQKLYLDPIVMIKIIGYVLKIYHYSTLTPTYYYYGLIEK